MLPTAGISCANGEFDATSVGCQEYDACAQHPCSNAGEVCVDTAAPSGAMNAQGRTCSCPVGQEVAAAANRCSDINACGDNPCSGNGVRCVDLPGQPNNGAGRRCECDAGLGEDVDGDCQEVDACIDNPCPGSNVDCADAQAPAPNSASGRTCSCRAGYTWGSGECENIDACEGNPCLTGGQPDTGRCTDVISSDSRSRTCDACPSGYVDSADGGNTNCVDRDFCDAAAQDACTALQLQACFDRAAPQAGYDCDTPICSNPRQAGADATSCQVCADGFEPNQRRSECVSCALGFGGRGGACPECPSGQQSNADLSGCVECPTGTVRRQGVQSTCMACPTYFYTEDSTECLSCTDPGENVVDNECVRCASNEIGSNGACQACPGGLVPVSPSECGAGTTTTIATTVVDTVEEPLTPDNFCVKFDEICPAAWDNAADGRFVTCDDGIAGLLPGSPGATASDTLACRIYHLGAARADVSPGRVAHCGHASSTGARVCSGVATPEDFCPYFVDVCGETASAGAWTTTASCMAGAQSMLSGRAGSTSGNTLACRAYHLGVAATSADDAGIVLHCGHASRSGGGVCSGQSTAEEFCSDYLTVCPSVSWTNIQSCLDAVPGFISGTAGSTTRNTLACRVYHLAAAKTDPETHCPHASVTGGGVCTGLPSAAEFCAEFAQTCPGLEWASCAPQYGGLLSGEIGDTEGSTQACRAYHLTAALSDPDTHCAHASRSGGGVCGSGIADVSGTATTPDVDVNLAQVRSAAVGGKAGFRFSVSDAIKQFLIVFVVVYVVVAYLLFVKASEQVRVFTDNLKTGQGLPLLGGLRVQTRGGQN